MNAKCYSIFILIFFLVHIENNLFAQSGSAKIIVQARDMTPKDTLELRIFRKYHYGDIFKDNPSESIKIASKNGTYHYELDSIPRLTRVFLYKSDEVYNGYRPVMNWLEGYLINPGDSIHIQAYPLKGNFSGMGTAMKNGKLPLIEHVLLKFGGNGSEKFTVKWAIDSLRGSSIRDIPIPTSAIYKDRDSGNAWAVSHHQFRWDLILSALNLYRPYLGEEVYYQLYADYLGSHYSNFLYGFRFSLYHPEGKDNWNLTRDLFVNEYSKLLGDEIPLKYRHNSYAYFGYVDKWLDNLYSVQHREKGKYPSLYALIKDVAPLGLQENLLTAEVVNRYGRKGDPEMLKDALKLIKDPFLRKAIEDLDQLHVGMPAASYTLLDKEDNKISSDQFKGKVVFMDFWYLSCLHCRTYINQVVKPVYDKYKDDDRVVFVTVAAEEKSAFLKGLEWAELHGSNAFDLYTGPTTFQHPLITYYKIRGYPHPMIVDKQGNIFMRSDSRLRSQEGLIAAIEAALSQTP